MLKTLSVLGYLAMAVGLVALIELRSLFSASPAVIVPQLAAVALIIWARITFGRRSFHFAANPTTGGLVTNGPYRYIRHPIYTSACLFVIAGVVAHWSTAACRFGGLVVAGSIGRVFCEEALLPALYPEYIEYAAKTWRMVPYVF
jgi:protein-S-isoprenylcysteine O-methyltransferase Ste14